MIDSKEALDIMKQKNHSDAKEWFLSNIKDINGVTGSMTLFNFFNGLTKFSFVVSIVLSAVSPLFLCGGMCAAAAGGVDSKSTGEAVGSMIIFALCSWMGWLSFKMVRTSLGNSLFKKFRIDN